MELLLILLFVLGGITLVGHGIWVALAAFFRLLTGDSEAPGSAVRRAEQDCLGCGRHLQPSVRVCPDCRLERGGRLERLLRELDGAIRQIRGLEERNEIDSEQADRLVGLLRARRRGLFGAPAPDAPPGRVLNAPQQVRTTAAKPAILHVADEILDVLPVPATPLPPVGLEEAPPPPAPVPVPEPLPPRRSLGQVLAGFMEERNILWGELVGGLLIVGCSIALVLTLWRTLQTIPYFPFLLFAALTGALFAAGQYTLHHWKLQATSRGLLLIALLLVPLNLLLLADPGSAGPARTIPLLHPLLCLAAFVAFVVLVRVGGRDLIGADLLPGLLDRRWLLAAAIVGSAGVQLFAPALLDAPGAGPPPWTFALLAGLSVAWFVLPSLAVTAGLSNYGRSELRLSRPQAHALFAFVGLGGFAALAALGHLLTLLPAPRDGAGALSVPFVLMSVPAVLVGLLVAQRLDEGEATGLRAVGTGVSLAGVMLMLLGVGLAWPAPWPLLATLLLSGLILLLAAAIGRLPWMVGVGLTVLLPALLLTYHLGCGHLPVEEASNGLLRLLGSAESGAVLAGAGLLLALVAAVWKGCPGAITAAVDAVALLAAAAALLLTTSHGLLSPGTAALSHAGAAAVALLVSRRRGERVLPEAAGILAVVGTLWGLHALVPEDRAVWGVVLAGEALVLAAAGWLCRAMNSPALARASGRTAALAGAAGLAFAVLSGSFATEYAHTWTTSLVAAAILVAAVGRRDPWLFAGFQVATTGALLCGLTAFAAGQDWLNDLRQWQTYGIGLGVLGVVWAGMRRTMGASSVGKRLIEPPAGPLLLDLFHPPIDQLILGITLIGGLLLATAGASLGVSAEWAATPHIDQAARIAGPAGWGWLAALLVALLVPLIGPARLEETRTRQAALVGLLLLALTAAMLYASWHAADLAGASALRWGLATLVLVGSALLWVREDLERLARGLGLCGAAVVPAYLPLLATVATLVVLLTVVLASLGFQSVPLPGPLAESPFARMGRVVSSVTPLALVVIALLGTAIRERATIYASAAQWLAAASVVGGYALGVVQAGGTLNADHAAFAGFLGALTLSAAGLAWLLGRQRVGQGRLFDLGVWLGLVAAVLVAVQLLPELLLGPGPWFRQQLTPVTLATGLVALLIGAAPALWHSVLFGSRRRVHIVGVVGLLGGLLLAGFFRPRDTSAFWLSYHVLAAAWSSLGLVPAVLGWLLPLPSRPRARLFPSAAVRGWTILLLVLQTLVALRGVFGPGVDPWVPPGVLLASAVLAASVALAYRRGGFAHASGWLFTLALLLMPIPWPDRWLVARTATLTFGLAVSAAFWLALELPLVGAAGRIRWRRAAYAPGAVTLALALLFSLAAWGLTDAATGGSSPQFGVPVWLAAGAVGLTLTLAILAGRAGLALPELYVLGLAVLGLALHATHPTARELAWRLPLALAGQVLLASLSALLWSLLTPRGQGEESRFRLAHPTVPDREWSWLLPAQLTIGLLAVLFAVLAATHNLPALARLAGATTAAGLLAAALALARVAPLSVAESLRLIALALVPVVGGLAAWAIPDPSGPHAWLERNGWLLPVLTLAGLLGLEWLPRWPAGRQLSLTVAGVAVVVLAIVVAQMLPAFDPVSKRTPLDGLAVLTILLSAVALIAALVRLAVRSGHDPLGLSEAGRTGYVYLAEGLLVLLLVTLRLNVPELFRGFLGQYWTFVVLVVAFAGVGAAEWFERRELRVLAVPLARTGVLLPLLPLLAFWARPPQALLAFAADHAPGLLPFLSYLDHLPWHFDAHALVWLLTSMIYLFLALSRRSTTWGLVAALAANFGFWALLAHVGVGFLVHPQAWLIPLAAIVLLAEYLHRHQLDPRAAETLRYLGVTLIYVASTADLYLAGLGNSLWLPILLAVLCVAGVLLGILLRIRAFLFLGVGFLLVDVLSMIWYAAVDRSNTWLWWVSGIVLGAAILALFAVFEKRKNEVVALLDDLRQWR